VLRGQRLAAAVLGLAFAVLLIGALSGALVSVTPVGLAGANSTAAATSAASAGWCSPSTCSRSS